MILSVIASLIIILLSVKTLLSDGLFVSKTQGEVVYPRCKKIKDDLYACTYRIRYTINGKKYIHPAITTYGEKVNNGQAIEVEYNESDPTVVRPFLDKSYILSIITLLVGIVILGLSLYPLLKQYKSNDNRNYYEHDSRE